MTEGALREVLHLDPALTIDVNPHEGVTVRGPREPLVLGHLSPGLKAMLAALTRDGATAPELLELGRDPRAGAPPTVAIALLGRLARGHHLYRTLWWQGVPLLTARDPQAGRGRWSAAPEPAAVLQLSRFAWLHREGETLRVDSPLTCAHVLLRDARASAIVCALARPTTGAALARDAGLPLAMVEATLGMLLACSLLVLVPADGIASEEAEPALGMWDPVELMAHHRVRQQAGASAPLGKTFPFVDRFDPLPVTVPARGREHLPLPRPSLERLRRHDPPLAAVMEVRRSQRRHGHPTIALEAVSELLFRTLRVRRVMPSADGTGQGRSDRPYPSAGACYPLEAHLVVGQCRGLAAGLYHYDPLEHALGRLDVPVEPAQALLGDAMRASGASRPPQVLLVLTARFGRTAWVYGGLAHRLVLVEVGVVFQSIYVAATAMGLATCALGSGSATRFAALTGLDPRQEASVGEIMIGSAHAEPIESPAG